MWIYSSRGVVICRAILRNYAILANCCRKKQHVKNKDTKIMGTPDPIRTWSKIVAVRTDETLFHHVDMFFFFLGDEICGHAFIV